MELLLPLLIYLPFLDAYVVPTGSMAPTILGYHKDVVCPKCKSRFSVNASSEQWDFRRPSKLTGCTCASCRYEIDFDKEKMAPRPQGGDRVLVFRYLPKSLRRHDVVVHYVPMQWFAPERRYVKYISRLVGLPGETLAIHEGRLYACTDLKYPDDKAKPEERWHRAFMHVDDDKAVQHFEKGKFQIVRKSPELLLAQRRLVYDHDFPASDQPSRWAAGKESAWKTAAEHGFQHDGKGDRIDWLVYRHLLRTADPGPAKPYLIMDDLAYNNWKAAEQLIEPNPFWAGDLMIDCQATLAKAEGELYLDLARGQDRFQARIDLTSGRCTLLRLEKDAKPRELAVKDTMLNKPGSYRLRLANCENRLMLWVDDQMPFGDGVVYAPSTSKGPTAEDLAPARIGSLKASVQVRRLQLWRDIYYTPDTERVREERVDARDPATWEPLRKPRIRTYYVQPGHYFFISDNPSFSSDSRDWGVVPEQLLVGKVLLGYYPLSRIRGIR